MDRLAEVSAWRIWTAAFVLVNLALLCSANQLYRGRHVCTRNRYSVRPVHIKQSYKRPVHTLDLKKCEEEGEQPCNRTHVTYKTVYRSVVKMRLHREKVPGCCPGWKKRSPHDISCLQPECSKSCENGGHCVGPETCLCTEGYTGRYCHIDIDECSGRNQCQQKCINKPGTYECACVEGFKLAEDESSCELCLTCDKDFQNLQAEVVALPEEMEKRAEETRRNTQADMMQEIKRQSETFEKLQSQYEAIMVIQKQMSVLPEITTRLDNLTELRTEVNELKALGPQVKSLEAKMEDGLASLKLADAGLDAAIDLAVQKLQNDTMLLADSRSRVMEHFHSQQEDMSAKITYLEQETESLHARLEDALEELRQKGSAVSLQDSPPTQDPYSYGGDPQLTQRIASLSDQISMLEERMAKCQCDSDGYGYK